VRTPPAARRLSARAGASGVRGTRQGACVCVCVCVRARGLCSVSARSHGSLCTQVLPLPVRLLPDRPPRVVAHVRLLPHPLPSPTTRSPYAFPYRTSAGVGSAPPPSPTVAPTRRPTVLTLFALERVLSRCLHLRLARPPRAAFDPSGVAQVHPRARQRCRRLHARRLPPPHAPPSEATRDGSYSSLVVLGSNTGRFILFLGPRGGSHL